MSESLLEPERRVLEPQELGELALSDGQVVVDFAVVPGQSNELEFEEQGAEEDEELEIERRWLVDKDLLPELILQAGKVEAITSGYLKDAEGVRHRIRQTYDMRTGKVSYMCNFKRLIGTSRLVRVEPKTPITYEIFKDFWPLTADTRLTKTRYHIPFGSGADKLDIELDDYGDLNYLIAEVEFDTEEEATAPDRTFPEYFGEEVTENKDWSNVSLAQHGTPEGYRNGKKKRKKKKSKS